MAQGLTGQPKQRRDGLTRILDTKPDANSLPGLTGFCVLRLFCLAAGIETLGAMMLKKYGKRQSVENPLLDD